MSAGKTEGSNALTTAITHSAISVVGHNGPASSETSDPLNWNVDAVEDKNPFSGFSEEHLSKLDEFLSSEEAKKILQQTSEGDFTSTMSELDTSGSAQESGEDFLKLDLLDGVGTHSAHLDHAYCLRSPKPELTAQPSTVTSSSKVVVVPMPTAVTESLFTQAPTAVTAETAGDSSPRKSARISLRRDQDEKATGSKQEPLHPGFVGAVHPGIVQPQHAGMPAIDVSPGKGRGRRSLIPEDRLDTPVSIRRSSRISDQEQRDLAEKIRQENVQKEKEAMEAIKKKEGTESDKGEKKVPKRGKKAEEQEATADVNESDDSDNTNVKKALSSPRVSARANKGKKAKRFAEEMEKEESPTKKGNVAKTGKGKAKQESEAEESEEESPKKTKGKKGGKKNDSVDSEEGSPPKGKKKGRGKKEQPKSQADSDSESDDEPLVKPGKKKTAAKAAAESEEDDDSEEESSDEESVKTTAKGKGRGKKGGKQPKEVEADTKPSKKKGKKGKNKKEESESEEEEVEPKKTGKKGVKGKGKKAQEEESDDDSEDIPLRSGKKKGKAIGKGKSVGTESPKKGPNKKGRKKKNEEEDEDESGSESDVKDSPGKGKVGPGKQKNENKSPKRGRPCKAAVISENNSDKQKAKGDSPKNKSKNQDVQNPDARLTRSIFNVLETDILPTQGSSENSAADTNLSPSQKPSQMAAQEEVVKETSASSEKVTPTDPGVEEINYEDFISAIGSSNGVSDVSQESENKKHGRKRQDSKDSNKQSDDGAHSHHHHHHSHHHHHHHHSKDKNESESKNKDQSQDHGEQKMPKHVKKKPRKSEDVVDPSVMDLFKPDVVKHDDSTSSKKKLSEAGEKKDTPGLTRKSSTESGSKDASSLKRRLSDLDGQKVDAEKKSAANDGDKMVKDSHGTEETKECNKLSESENKSENVDTGADKIKDEIKLEKDESGSDKCATDSKSDINSAKLEIDTAENSKVKGDTETKPAVSGAESSQTKAGIEKLESPKEPGKQSVKDTITSDIIDSKGEIHVSEKVDVKEKVLKQEVPVEKKSEVSKSEKHKSDEMVAGQKEVKVVRFSESENICDKKMNKSSEQSSPEEKRKRRLNKFKNSLKKLKSDDSKVESDEDSSDDEGQLSFEDDENDSDYEAPDEKYCICQQPYGKRFMICCDKCENWYHGSCVGISRVRGKEMEKNNEDYMCPVCKGDDVELLKQKITAVKSEKTTQKSDGDKSTKTEGNKVKFKDKQKSESTPKEHRKSIEGKNSVSNDPKASKISRKLSGESAEGPTRHSVDGSKTDSGNKTPRRLSKDGVKSSTPNDLDKSKSEGKEGDGKTPNKHKLHKRLSQDSSDQNAKRLKPSHHVDTAAQRCVVPGCNKYTKRYSVYCSTDCIHKHARDSIRLIHKNDTDDKKGAALKKITVVEKKSGRVLSGQSAPLETSLKSWLEQHPTFQVLQPKLRTDSTSKDKDRHRDRSKEKPKDGSKEKPKDGSKEKPKDGKETEKKEQDKPKEVKEGSSGKSEKSSKEESSGPDIVRLNVRKSLRDALLHRAEGADDIMLSNNEIRSTALKIEEELYKFFRETSHKYKAKYRSLVFNIKDSRNQGLFRKILNNHIKPHKLVRMSPEELASRELAKWREFEAKHQLEMIEQVEKEHMKEKDHYVKKTHKGEIDMDEDLSTLEDKGVEPKHKSAEAQPVTPEDGNKDIVGEFIVDTTAQHKMHLFDLNCKVCTGKMAPPVEESPQKKVTVVRKPSVAETEKDSSDKSTKKKSHSEAKPAENSVKDMPKVTSQSKPETPKVDSTVTVRSPDSALQSGLEKPKFKPSGPQLWKGFIQMQDVAKFVTTAYRVSGPCDKLEIPDTVHVCGRIAPEQIMDYLAKMKKIGTKDMVILRFIPGSDEEKTSYINLYSYLNSRSRCGVVGNKAKHIKDFYILPLASHSKIPAVLQPFDGPGLEENRPHMLLAVIVKQKSKRHSSDTDRRDDHKKSKSDSKSSEDKTRRTPPVAGEKGSHKVHSSSKHKSILKKESPRAAVKPSPGSSSATSTPTSTSAGSTPGINTPRASVDSQDPIVQVYGSSGALAEDLNDDSTNSPSSKKLAADDIPYDPEDDSQLPYKQSRPSTVTTSKAPQPAKEAFSKAVVTQLLQQIAKCNNPAESTAITVTAISTLPSVQDKRKFLLELTSQVEAEKKLLEQKLVSTLTARTLVSAIYAISAASKTVVPASKMMSAQGQTTVPVASSSVEVPQTTSTETSGTEATLVKSSSSDTGISANTDVKTTGGTDSTSLITSSLKNGSKKSVTFSSEVMVSTTVASDDIVSGGSSVSSEVIMDSEASISAISENVETKNESEISSQSVTNNSSEVNTTFPAAVSPVETVPLDPAQMPEALKSLFSFIPGSNFSHLSNIKESTSTPDPETSVDFKGEPVGKSTASQKVETKLVPPKEDIKPESKQDSRHGFNVSLLDFDYGDSDSDDDTPVPKQTPVKEIAKETQESTTEDTVETFEKDIIKFEKEMEQTEQTMIMSDAERDRELMPPPPPLPKDDLAPPPPLQELPPLPSEPPPPLPEHEPEEEMEEENQKKKKKKKKPPPEIVLQPTNPVGKAILEATFLKLEETKRQEMVVPPPPLPPIALSSPISQSGPMSGVIAQSPSGMPVAMQGGISSGPSIPISVQGGIPNSITSQCGMLQPPPAVGVSIPGPLPSPGPQYPRPSQQQQQRPVMQQNKGIPSIFDLDVTPTKDFDSGGGNWADPITTHSGEHSGNWVEDEALTLPLEDQDLRKDQDFRHSADVDERKKPWGDGQRQKFPPPWAQDVDHRNKNMDKKSVLHSPRVSSSEPHSALDRDFRKFEDNDYRTKDYRRDNYDFAYAEDQDYRGSRHHKRKKRRRYKGRSDSDSTDSYKKSRRHSGGEEEGGDNCEENEASSRVEEKSDNSDSKNSEKSDEPPPRPHRMDKELPIPVPPPGVVPQPPGPMSQLVRGPRPPHSHSARNPAIDNPSRLPPGAERGNYPPFIRSQSPGLRPNVKKGQPLPPGVDPWDG